MAKKKQCEQCQKMQYELGDTRDAIGRVAGKLGSIAECTPDYNTQLAIRYVTNELWEEINNIWENLLTEEQREWMRRRGEISK